jgi:hypothetical protein
MLTRPQRRETALLGGYGDRVDHRAVGAGADTEGM